MNNIITINRTQPFDPAKFLSQGWIIEEQDERSLALPQVDLAKVQLEYVLKKGEEWIKGEEKLKRLKLANHIRLDAKIFQTLWQDQRLIPERWKEKTNGKITRVYFDGSILRCRQDDHRYVLYLYWDDGRWDWYPHWLEDGSGVGSPSAVLAS